MLLVDPLLREVVEDRPDDVVEDGLRLLEESVTSMLSSTFDWRSFSALLLRPSPSARARAMFSSLGMKSFPAYSSNPQV